MISGSQKGSHEDAMLLITSCAFAVVHIHFECIRLTNRPLPTTIPAHCTVRLSNFHLASVCTSTLSLSLSLSLSLCVSVFQSLIRLLRVASVAEKSAWMACIGERATGSFQRKHGERVSIMFSQFSLDLWL